MKCLPGGGRSLSPPQGWHQPCQLRAVGEAARMVLLNAHSVPLTDTAVMVEGGTGDEACFLRCQVDKGVCGVFRLA